MLRLHASVHPDPRKGGVSRRLAVTSTSTSATATILGRRTTSEPAIVVLGQRPTICEPPPPSVAVRSTGNAMRTLYIVRTRNQPSKSREERRQTKLPRNPWDRKRAYHQGISAERSSRSRARYALDFAEIMILIRNGRTDERANEQAQVDRRRENGRTGNGM